MAHGGTVPHENTADLPGVKVCNGSLFLPVGFRVPLGCGSRALQGNTGLSEQPAGKTPAVEIQHRTARVILADGTGFLLPAADGTFLQDPGSFPFRAGGAGGIGEPVGRRALLACRAPDVGPAQTGFGNGADQVRAGKGLGFPGGDEGLDFGIGVHCCISSSSK